MADRRGVHTATPLGNGPNAKVLVVGGVNTVKRGCNWMANYLASGEQYNPADTWSRADSMATARSLPPPTGGLPFRSWRKRWSVFSYEWQIW